MDGSRPIVRLVDLAPGHKMCCSCFEFIPFDDLYVDEDGQKWDFCVPCKEDVVP